MSPDEKANRRERINNSDAQLPGDQERADAEENEDFDAGDTGNFRATTANRQAGDPLRREQINRSSEQLEGDLQRGDDDSYVNEYGEDAPPPRQGSGADTQDLFDGDGAASNADETAFASRAFGGSPTSYGQIDSDKGSESGPTSGVGTAQGSNDTAGVSGSPTNAGGEETGMAVGGGTEGSVNLVNGSDAQGSPQKNPAGKTSIPTNEGGYIDEEEETTIHR